MKKFFHPIILVSLIFLPKFGCSGSQDQTAADGDSPGELALDDEQAAFLLAQKAVLDSYYDVAARVLRSFVRAFPASENTCVAKILLAQALYHQREFDQAVVALDDAAKATNAESFSDTISFWRAKCDLARGAVDAAMTVFARLAEKGATSRYHLYSLYNIGLSYEAKGEYETALKKIEETEQSDKQGLLFLPCVVHRARCLMGLQRLAEARDLLLDSIDKGPKNADVSEAFFLLGEIAVVQEDFETALKYYGESLNRGNLEGWHLEACYGMGWCLLKLKKCDEAVHVFENVRRLDPGETLAKRVDLSLCRARLLKGENDAAIVALKEYVDRYPGDSTIPEARYLIAEALANSEKYNPAIQEYDQLASMFPDSPLLDKVYFGKGQAFFLTGDYPKSAEAFQKARDLSGDSRLQVEAARNLADALYRAMDYAGAAATYRELLERAPQDQKLDQTLFRLGWSYYRAGEFDNAIASLETLVTKFPDSDHADNALYRIGGAYYRKGECEKALAEYLKLEKIYPGSDLTDRVKYQIGLCHYNLGNYYPSLVSFRQVVEKFPQSPLSERSHYEIGWCHHQLGKHEEALKHFQKHVAQYGKTELSGEALFWIGEYHYNEGEYDPALENFRRLAEEHPNHRLADRALFWQGRSALNLGRHKEAVGVFSRLVDQFPDSGLTSDALYHLGMAYKGQDQLNEAVLTFRKVEQMYPRSYLKDELTWQIAECLLELGQRTEALTTYTTLLRSEDHLARARSRYGRGRCFKAGRRYSAAIAEFMVVIWEFPAEKELVSEAAFAAAKCYEELHQRQNAIRVYSLVVDGNLPGKKKAEAAIEALQNQSLLFFLRER